MFVFSSSSSECSSKCSPFCRISCRKEKTLDKLYCASYPSLSLHPATPILHPNAPNAKRRGYCKTIAGNCISFWVISQIRTETLIQGFSPFLYVPAKSKCKTTFAPGNLQVFSLPQPQKFPEQFLPQKPHRENAPTVPSGCITKRLPGFRFAIGGFRFANSPFVLLWVQIVGFIPLWRGRHWGGKRGRISGHLQEDPPPHYWNGEAHG